MRSEGDARLSTPIAKVLILAVAISCFPEPAKPYSHTRHRRTSHGVSQNVQPSPEIDARVADEIAKAQRTIDGLNTSGSSL